MPELNIKQTRVDLKIFSDESLPGAVLTTYSQKLNLISELKYLSEIETELLAYQSSLQKIFSMSSDFARTFSYIVSPSHLPPNVLTPKAIAENCIDTFINELPINLETVLPSSIIHAKKVLIAIRKFQRIFRIRKK